MTRREVSRRIRSGEEGVQSGDEALDKAQSGESIRILTHNIRYATKAPFKGEERWPIRCPRLCGELTFNSVLPTTFICLQEVLHQQLLDIHNHLNTSETPNGNWAFIGVGRDDGKEAGEYSPIFYRPSVWKLDRWTTIWLSETPKVPSKGWDATSYRIATVGHFVHHRTRQKIIISSTHLDNDGAVSRVESAKLLLEVLGSEAETSQTQATILAGDFNSPPTDEAYQIVVAPNSSMVDVFDVVPKEKHYGNEITFTGFSGDDEPSRIDFIFTRKFDLGTTLNIDTYGVLSNRFDDGVYSSDHRAVVADFYLGPS